MMKRKKDEKETKKGEKKERRKERKTKKTRLRNRHFESLHSISTAWCGDNANVSLFLAVRNQRPDS